MSSTPFISREVERVVTGVPVSDGAGVNLKRVLTGDLQRRLDPFLMLDEFGSEDPGDYLAGFPDHPHRGFETVTYMLVGRMRHRDNAGNEGLLTPGSVQWMTAGRGIVHSEMPEQENGRMQGFQLWVNLAAKDKMTEPAYRDIAPENIPVLQLDGGITLTVIAGRVGDTVGAVERPTTEPLYLDIELPADTGYEARIPAGHNAFLYVYEGAAKVGARGQNIEAGQMAVLSNAVPSVGVAVSSAQGTRLILVAGKPLNEPIAQWGPFVMNSRAEIEQAFDDFRAGRF